MKRLFILLIVLAITVPAFAQIQAVMSEVNGKVELKAPGGSWQAASVGDQVGRGTTVSTGFGATAAITMGNSVVRVQQLTRMTLEELVESEGTVNTDLFLRVGRVKSEVKSTGGLSNNFKLRSTQATAAVRGTEFTFDGNNLIVTDGVVVLSNSIGHALRVAAGEQSKTDGLAAPTSPEVEKIVQSVVDFATNPSESIQDLPEITKDNALVVIRVNWQ